MHARQPNRGQGKHVTAAARTVTSYPPEGGTLRGDVLSRRRPATGVGLTILAAAILFLASAERASAATYCVEVADTAGCDFIYSGAGDTKLQTALNDAGGAGSDTVRIGTESQNGVFEGTYQYLSINPVTIQGSGVQSTVLANPDTSSMETVLSVGGNGDNVTVSNLKISISQGGTQNNPPAIDTGLSLWRATASGVEVASTSGNNLTGVSMNGGVLTGSSVQMPLGATASSTGVATSGSEQISKTTVTAGTGISHSSIGTAQTLTVDRVSVRANRAGLHEVGGTTSVENAVIDLGAAGGSVGLYAFDNGNPTTEPMNINARHVTVVGGGSSAGARIVATRQADATLTLRDSLISQQLQFSIRIDAGSGETATVTTDYSNYEPADVYPINTDGTGIIAYTATNQTNVAPGFADPATGDYRLTFASPLVDAGDPAVGGPATDRDGSPRLADGNCDGTPRRDIGAYELAADCLPPETLISSGPGDGATTDDPTPTFAFSSPDEANVTFECSLDGAPFASCSSPLTTSPLSDGAHTFQARAIDRGADAHPNAAADPSPASRAFTVDTSTPPGSPPSGDPPAGDPPADNADRSSPETTITDRPKKRVKTRRKKAKVIFEFIASEPGSSFACRVDAKPFRPCDSELEEVLRVKRGKHAFEVRATDPAGNSDGTPARFAFRVKRVG